MRCISSSINGVTDSGCGFQSPPRYLTWAKTNCVGVFPFGWLALAIAERDGRLAGVGSVVSDRRPFGEYAVVPELFQAKSGGGMAVRD